MLIEKFPKLSIHENFENYELMIPSKVTDSPKANPNLLRLITL